MLHFFTCPSVSDTFNELKNKVLSFTENLNRFPIVSDTQFLLGDFSASNIKIRTGIWVSSVVLYKIYSLKIAGKGVTFDFVWNWAKEDIRIANLCQNGPKLDEVIFES